jgi:hypothetical protein
MFPQRVLLVRCSVCGHDRLMPPEIAAAGHDRVPINLTWDAALHWLTPEGRSDAELQALLDERQRPFYEHREAA